MQSERQKQIIEQAIKIIDKNGIQGLTIKNLSKGIGISEPAIYRHFGSKTEIISAILDRLLETANYFSTINKRVKGPALEKIKFLINKLVENFSKNPALISVIFAEDIFKNQNILKNKIIFILNKNEESIEEILETGKKEGNIAKDFDTKSLALIIMGSLRLLVKRWHISDFEFNLQDNANELVHTLTKLIAKDG